MAKPNEPPIKPTPIKPAVRNMTDLAEVNEVVFNKINFRGFLFVFDNSYLVIYMALRMRMKWR